MRTRYFLLTIPLVALVPLVAQQPPPPPKTATVPFTMLPSNHMVVEAKLNGKGPYRFIFDLGAPITILSNRAAEASGAVKADAPKSFFMGQRGEANIEKLEMSGMTADDVPVIVLDHPLIKAFSDIFHKPIDGIIGYTFWARYRTSIDYKDLKMTFTPVDFKVRNLMKDLPAQLAGPKVAKTFVVAPHGLWGINLGKPAGIESPGMPITKVLPGSPAALAGLQVGDILTSVDGRWTTSLPDTYRAAESVEPEKPVTVVVLRDGKEVTLTVTPKEGI